MDEMMITLQTRLLHQEEEIATLSKELYLQQKEMVKLKQQFAELAMRFKTLASEGDGVRDISHEPPPPHY